MQTDFRKHPFFERAKQLTRAWLRPGTGEVATLSQLSVRPDGLRATAAASVCEALEGTTTRDGTASTRIAVIDLRSGELEVFTQGPGFDTSPKYSPDGHSIGFLSDREHPQLNRLRILDCKTGVDRATPSTDGFIEYLHWAADGQSILLGVADYGSDIAGAQGGFAIGDQGKPLSWAPRIEGLEDNLAWRSLWLYDIASDSVHRITPEGLNIWEAVWCGPDCIAAICSDRPEETCWYRADLRMIDMTTGSVRTLFNPSDQIGKIAVTPNGRTIAVIEAVCSDRNIVAGDVRLIDVANGTVTPLKSVDADVTQLIWRDDDNALFVAGRGPETFIGLFDRKNEVYSELWQGIERVPSGVMFPEIVPLDTGLGDALFMCESFFDAPQLIAFESGCERVIRSFGTPELEATIKQLGFARDFSWKAPDGLTIHGWLLTPRGPGPHPVIMQVHGGPVWYTRPSYVGRSALSHMALAAGYALFQPNPRGSSGRGQNYARLVFGDMGGSDTQDYLSGLDALSDAKIIDSNRIGVTGASYGGYISSWLITQDNRFAASVPVAPVTNWVSQQLTCNIPSFCEIFLDDNINNPDGKYFSRSPIHFADRVKTPTLSICGGLDRITPAGQALEFHRALLAAGVESVLATYPLDGHGIRTMPAVFDYTARVLDWFMKHMPATSNELQRGQQIEQF
ncbi:S9 family peptidase [Brucella cytisi]|uniref:S9 family peptidase n=1 Tax=Brucella cytisi TaxID=407152 RepID=UPI0035DABB54